MQDFLADGSIIMDASLVSHEMDEWLKQTVLMPPVAYRRGNRLADRNSTLGSC